MAKTTKFFIKIINKINIKHKLNWCLRNKKWVILFCLFSLSIFLFLWTQPAFDQTGTIKIWDRNKTLLYESAGTTGRKIPITFNKLPSNLINAAIASEDESFWTNPGVDFKAIIRAAVIDLKTGRIVSGASTITQQLARASIISPQQLQSRSIFRKVREILIALRLSVSYSKKDILTKYFNQMYFGNLAYGIQAASLTYFSKDSSQLSLAESAFLVGLLSSPDSRNPYVNIKEAKQRQNEVLALMFKDGYISKEQMEEAKKEQLTLTAKQTDIKAPHFVHYVLEELGNLEIGQGQGINVYTTLDYPTFELSETIASLWVNRLRDQHDLSNAALVLINNSTGEILDMLGGIDYFDASNSGQVNMATALRQPGSALKPVTYATAFMQGFTPATLIYDVKKVYKTKKGEGFTPNNYDGRFHGLVLAREALASSFNLPAVEMLNRVGIGNFLKVARDLGITTFNQEDRYDLSLTLGGGEVKLLDLTNVFASFARSGESKEPFAIEQVVTDGGKVLYKHEDKNGVQVLGTKGKQVAYLISNILSDPKARIPGFGEKNPLVLSVPAAVKTGTTTDWHDNWTVGYTPDYTVGVWVGNNDNHAMRDITGVVGAAPIWNQFFEEFLKGKPSQQFIRPDGIKTVEICNISGKLPDNLCTERSTELFVDGTEPQTVSHPYKKINIDIRNNLRAGDNCPKEYVREKIFIDFPPEVYTWAVEDGQEIIPREFSPLCSGDNQVDSGSYLQITYPSEKTVFQDAPFLVNNQAAVFEISVSPNIKEVLWYVDGKLLSGKTSFPFNASWKLKLGKHTINAVGKTIDGGSIKSQDVNISVIEYNGMN